jgi:C-terminal processing protease CtpA/Prc
VTSIREENAFFQSGQTAGFGIRLSTDGGARRVFVAEAFEGAPALANGIDRGAEILAVGTSEANLRTTADLIAAEGSISPALGPSTAGTTRVLRVQDASGVRNVTLAKADFAIRRSPTVMAHASSRTPAAVSAISTCAPSSTPPIPRCARPLPASARRASPKVIVDFRYNGGGLVSIAELMGDLLGANRSAQDVFSFTTFRPEKSQFNETRFFNPQRQSIAPTKIAFIGTGGTASASELGDQRLSCLTCAPTPRWSAPTRSASPSARSRSTAPSATIACAWWPSRR